MQYQSPPSGSALEHRLMLYSTAVYLFDRRLSHPQIVELLSPYEPDLQFLTSIVDKAMREEWDQLHEFAREQFEANKSYEEVTTLLREKEKDEEIVQYFANNWYGWKTEMITNLQESPENVYGGITWIIICSGGVMLTFVADFNWFSKIIWMLGLLASILQFALGYFQKRLARRIDKFMRKEI